jgi:hypothetical protein
LVFKNEFDLPRRAKTAVFAGQTSNSEYSAMPTEQEKIAESAQFNG